MLQQMSHGYVGCRLCSVSISGEPLDKSFCGTTEQCYFGMVGHPARIQVRTIYIEPRGHARHKTSRLAHKDHTTSAWLWLLSV